MLKNLFYIELVLAVVAVLGFALRIQGIELGQLLTLVASSLLALGYVVMAFVNSQNRPAGALLILNWLVLLNCALAVQALGIKLFLLPGATGLLKVALYGFLGLVITLLINLWIAANAQVFEYYRQLLVRSLVIIGLTFMFFITPYWRIISLYYKNQPQKAQELIQRLDPPTPK
ncbi:MAG: hypothetical protein MUE85_12295 [Microscillaceae bacterium]|nr:hypothetical protein [Microscillaceae bacterium]